MVYGRHIFRPVPLHLWWVVHISSPRGGDNAYDGLYGQAPPERGIFFRLQAYERGGISLGEVYKWLGKSVNWVCERTQRAEQMNFMALKSRDNVLFLWLIPV